MRMFQLIILSAFISVLSVVPACGGPDGGNEDDDTNASTDVIAEIVCTPSCSGKECGPDGCGDYCGACEEGFSCNSEGTCKELPKCAIVAEVTCDEIVEGETTGLANDMDHYACEGYEGLGPDITYVFEPQIDDLVIVELLAATVDLDVMITQAPCNPDSCAAWGDDVAQLEVAGGKKYYIVVDGQEGLEGEFSFQVTCQTSCEVECEFKECGDDGCGGKCGECPVEAPYCVNFLCTDVCTPDCAGKQCGDDGCGSLCGECPVGDTCVDGVCPGLYGCTAHPEPGCPGCPCEECVCQLDAFCCDSSWDEICAGLCMNDCGQNCDVQAPCGNGVCGDAGETCQTCPEDCGCTDPQVCFAGTCCQPDCEGASCGDDGCGGICGSCPDSEWCQEGVCVPGQPGCIPSEAPGCNGCACEACVCEKDAFCCDTQWDNICTLVCVEQCGGCEPVVGCGDNFCDPVDHEDCENCPEDCGCQGEDICIDKSCCTKDCDGKQCGDDGCGGQCGDCGDGYCHQEMCYEDGAHCLELEPAEVNFGPVKVGAFKNHSVLINNCGTESLEVSEVTIKSGGSENIGLDLSDLPQVPFSLDVNSSYSFSVLYLPSEIAEEVDGQPVLEEAQVAVSVSSPELEQVVGVSGYGFDPACPVAKIALQEGEEVLPLTILHFDGSSSDAPEGEIVQYTWTVVSQPLGSTATFMPSDDVVDPTFAANVVGVYKFSLSIKDSLDQESCQTASTQVTVIPGEAIHIELLWTNADDPNQNDDMGANLDLHFQHPWAAGPDINGDGEPDGWYDDLYDCFWYQPDPDWGQIGNDEDNPQLARADDNGAGPEVITYNVPQDGSYLVGVHYWEDNDFGQAEPVIRVYVYSNLLIDTTGPLLDEKTFWDAVSLDWPSAKATLLTNDDGSMKVYEDYENPFFNP
jgi:hypothetical protein